MTRRKLAPLSLRKVHRRAWALGIGDGWRQPRELSTSSNIDHLVDPDDAEHWRVQESLDCGINLGQLLRSPLRHQRV